MTANKRTFMSLSDESTKLNTTKKKKINNYKMSFSLTLKTLTFFLSFLKVHRTGSTAGVPRDKNICRDTLSTVTKRLTKGLIFGPIENDPTDWRPKTVKTPKDRHWRERWQKYKKTNNNKHTVVRHRTTSTHTSADCEQPQQRREKTTALIWPQVSFPSALNTFVKTTSWRQYLLMKPFLGFAVAPPADQLQNILIENIQ